MSFSFKKVSGLRSKQTARTNRQGSGGSSSSEDGTTVFHKYKPIKKNPMVQSTSGIARKRKVEYSSSSSDSENEDRARLLGVHYKSSKTAEISGPSDMGATATLETETDFSVDSQSQFERAQDAVKETKGKADDKIYRGMNVYGQFIEKKDTAAGKASSGFVRKGPIRAPNFLRQSVRWDYQADLCKDYKETGFCTFGDSCKFMHDRTDYKHGWELEREWAEGRYGQDDKNPQEFEISSDEDELPFKCYLCRESFTDPVVTKCNHYFCEKCALDHYRKSQKCAVCDKNTSGVFNPAKELIARLKGEKSAKKRRRKESESSKSSESAEETPMEKLAEREENKSDGEKSEGNTKSENSDSDASN